MLAAPLEDCADCAAEPPPEATGSDEFVPALQPIKAATEAALAARESRRLTRVVTFMVLQMPPSELRTADMIQSADVVRRNTVSDIV